MGWIQINVKVPEERSWIALTEVDEAGEVHPLGYLSPEQFAAVRAASLTDEERLDLEHVIGIGLIETLSGQPERDNPSVRACRKLGLVPRWRGGRPLLEAQD